MMREALGALLLQGLTFAAVAQGSPHSATALDLQGSPVKVTAVEAGARDLGTGTKSPQLKFLLENVSAGWIDRVEMEAYVFTADGRERGFYSFSLLKVGLAPSQRRFFLFSTNAFELLPGDRIVLLPDAARGPEVRWEAGALDFAPGRGAKSAAGAFGADLMAASEPRPFAESIPDLDCERKCDVRAEKCTSLCPGGVSEFSCACGGDGSISSTCKCQNKPAA